MAFAIFQDENIAQGIAKNSQFQAGVSDFDPYGNTLEKGVLLPTPGGNATWVHYENTIYCVLDSGIVTHRTLPQFNTAPDTLASCMITDTNIDKITGKGVNTKSVDQFADVVQRMAHSQYRFCMKGEAMRVGEQVPIPGLKLVGGVSAIPHDNNPQWAYNKIAGNYSGVILWYAEWELWYTVAVPPRSQQLPPPNLAQHIAADSPYPTGGIQAPISQPDDNAQTNNPVGNLQSGVASGAGVAGS